MQAMLEIYVKCDRNSVNITVNQLNGKDDCPGGGGYCHTKTVGVCHQSPMEHMERERKRNQEI